MKLSFVLVALFLFVITKVYAETSTYQKIDDNTIKVTTQRDPEVTTINIEDLKNDVINAQANLDYFEKQTTIRRLDLETILSKAQTNLSESAKVGVDIKPESP